VCISIGNHRLGVVMKKRLRDAHRSAHEEALLARASRRMLDHRVC
jgi:hypothetical protein